MNHVTNSQSVSLPIAVVTGGTSGIGLAIVHELARDHLVYALGRDNKKIEKLKNKENIIPIKIELTNKKERDSFFLKIKSVNVLVHSAAISEKLSLEESAYRDWEKIFSINVFVPAEVTRLCLHHLRQCSGQIIFINSGAGQRGIAGHTLYASSKFALRGLAESLRLEECHAGVKVATLYPGPTDSEDEEEINKNKIKWLFSKAIAHAKAVRTIVNIEDNTQISEISVRPRIDYNVK